MGSLCGFAHQVFEFGEDLFDGVEVWAVRREEHQARAACPDGGADGGVLVAGEVVEDDNVAGCQCRAKLLLDPGGEACSVDRLIEDAGRIDPVAAQGGDEGHGLPMAIGHLGMQPLALWRPAAQRGHVGLGPGLIDKDEAAGIRSALELLPLFASPGDLGAQLFGGQHAFF